MQGWCQTSKWTDTYSFSSSHALCSPPFNPLQGVIFGGEEEHPKTMQTWQHHFAAINYSPPILLDGKTVGFLQIISWRLCRKVQTGDQEESRVQRSLSTDVCSHWCRPTGMYVKCFFKKTWHKMKSNLILLTYSHISRNELSSVKHQMTKYVLPKDTPSPGKKATHQEQLS